MDIKKIAIRVANRFMISKTPPAGLFKRVFFNIKEKLNSLKEQESKKAIANVSAELKGDLISKGVKVLSLDVKLGKFRGHPYITSAKLTVKINANKAQNLLGYLQQKYSPKYLLKGIENNIATFNIR